MLNHIGQSDIAEKVQNAWLTTLEEGIHTYDIYKEGTSKEKLGTKEFAQAVIKNLGSLPKTLKSVSYAKGQALNLPKYQRKKAGKKELLGVDLFVHWAQTDTNKLGAMLEAIASESIKLSMITNRGIKVYPDGFPETFLTDHWRCRFKKTEGEKMSNTEIIELLQKAEAAGIDIIKTENLYAFDGKPAFSLGQGQ
jgi:isocitrate dehydrogenase